MLKKVKDYHRHFGIEKKRYEDWRFQVELWEKACDMAEVKKAERGYRLYDKLKDIKCKGVGEKIITAVQIGKN